MEPKLHKALKLIDGGASVGDTAKLVGISRQGIYAGLKARARQAKRELRLCSECGVPLPETVRSVAVTCSGKCRVTRMRRLKAAEAG